MPVAVVPNLVPAMPEIFLALAAMALLMLGVFQREADKAAVIRFNRLAIRLGALALLLALLLVVTISARGAVLTFDGMFISDDFAIFFKVLILLASAFSLIVAQDYLELNGIARFEFVVLVLFAATGMMLMISANDFIALYLGLEMQSLALYVIASFHRDSVRSVEAGLKYFVLGALASGMLLYGVSLVYGYVGATGFDAIGAVLRDLHGAVPPTGLIVGLVFVAAGLAFKVSAVPFHMWTPDVYQGAPTPVTAFFALAPKAAAIALLLRVMIEPFGALLAQWQQLILFISMASMVLGAFAAIGQSNIKRLMAYSSISNVGYALIGLAVGGEEGIRGVLIYMAIYLVMTLGTFTCILCMRRREQMVEGISDLAGLSRTNPMIALALAIFMFSMAGIPPLAGFFGKLYIFLAAVDRGLYTLAIVGVLSSVVAAFYYLRIVKVMYFDEAADPLDRASSTEIRLVMLVSAIVIVLFFVYPEPILSSAGTAAASLFSGG
ncbi:MAG: NADH-quinone oxidoreductase subunit NuoN [Rhodospirillales bacterium]|nr:NADH-quinone oxidoreductase subunit NuoN [Rhodospirillales bacterium]